METARYFLDEFMNLPRRAQEVVFASFFNDNAMGTWGQYDCFLTRDCESPIEEIFSIAFDYVGEKLKTPYNLESQKEISTSNGKTYRADFYYECKCGYRLIIECDGHDFHEKTKEQVAKNNERDFDLKKDGYDIIHFSGSQIYREPLKCAYDAVLYITSKIGGIE